MISNHMNPARAREIAQAPDLPWTPDLIKALATEYLKAVEAVRTLSNKLDDAENECNGLHNSVWALHDELSETRAILRGLYP